MKISKSKLCARVQCLKRLYLLVHEPELAAELDAVSEAIMTQGRVVGLLARQDVLNAVGTALSVDRSQIKH